MMRSYLHACWWARAWFCGSEEARVAGKPRVQVRKAKRRMASAIDRRERSLLAVAAVNGGGRP